MRDVIEFFATGKPSFDRAETLELMRVMDAIFKSKRNKGKWVNL